MTSIAQFYERRLDLAKRSLGHRGVAAPLGEAPQRDALIAKTRGPVERHALAGPFLERLAIGGDGLFQLRRPALALAEIPERDAQVVEGGTAFVAAARGHQFKASDLDRDQKVKIDPLFVTPHVERVSAFTQCRKLRRGVVG